MAPELPATLPQLGIVSPKLPSSSALSEMSTEFLCQSRST